MSLPDNVDFALLRKQKLWLVKQAERSEEAQGLLNFLDSIQDKYADVLGEEVVFGILNEEA